MKKFEVELTNLMSEDIRKKYKKVFEAENKERLVENLKNGIGLEFGEVYSKIKEI